MTYRVELRRAAQRALDRLPGKDFTAVVADIARLADNPRLRGVEKIKQAGLWRIRQGDYRVVYSIDDAGKLVIILRVGHRREIYRSL